MKSTTPLKTLLFAVAIALFHNVDAQDPSAIVEYESTSQGVLIPSLSETQRMAIDSPATGLMVFQNDLEMGIYINLGTKAVPDWVRVGEVANRIADADGDTRVQTEESPDEDLIRIDLEGQEKFRLGKNSSDVPRLEITESDSNTLVGFNAGSMIQPVGMTLGSLNSFFGHRAGQSAIQATSNTLIGANAGRGLTSGNHNTAIGNSSGEGMTTNFGNTFVGSNTGTLISSGSYNTFLGYFAGRVNNNTTGNTFIGGFSGDANTTGSGNTALGYATLSTNEESAHNTAIGYEAMLASLEGDNNTVLGYKALSQSVTGDNHTALGMYSLWYNQSGVSSTAVGFGAGAFDTISVRNVYIGTFAGRGGITSTTGLHNKQDNVMIGYEAGFNNKGNGNVMIGFQAGKEDSTSNDRLFIDNSDTDVPLIWGAFDFRRIGINREATTNTLEVGGNASKASAGDWLANSDRRLKTDINALDGREMLERLLLLRGVTYRWNDDQTNMPRPEGLQYGLIAQDIREAFPTLVSEDAEGYLQTAYGTYDAMYVEVIRYLHDRIEFLESEKAGLEERLDVQEAKLDLILEQLETYGGSGQ